MEEGGTHASWIHTERRRRAEAEPLGGLQRERETKCNNKRHQLRTSSLSHYAGCRVFRLGFCSINEINGGPVELESLLDVHPLWLRSTTKEGFFVIEGKAKVLKVHRKNMPNLMSHDEALTHSRGWLTQHQGR